MRNFEIAISANTKRVESTLAALSSKIDKTKADLQLTVTPDTSPAAKQIVAKAGQIMAQTYAKAQRDEITRAAKQIVSDAGIIPKPGGGLLSAGGMLGRFASSGSLAVLGGVGMAAAAGIHAGGMMVQAENAGPLAQISAMRQFMQPGIANPAGFAKSMGAIAAQENRMMGQMFELTGPWAAQNRAYYEQQRTNVQEVAKQQSDLFYQNTGMVIQQGGIMQDPRVKARKETEMRRYELETAKSKAMFEMQMAGQLGDEATRKKAGQNYAWASADLADFNKNLAPMMAKQGELQYGGMMAGYAGSRMQAQRMAGAIAARMGYDVKGQFVGEQAAGLAGFMAQQTQQRLAINQMEPKLRAQALKALDQEKANYLSQMKLAARDYELTMPNALVTSGREGLAGFANPAAGSGLFESMKEDIAAVMKESMQGLGEIIRGAWEQK